MFNQLKLINSIFKMELRSILAYRFSFWINFLGTSIGQLLLSYFLWSAIFKGDMERSIGGMKFPMMLFYSLLAPMIIKTVMGLQMLDINQDIYTGGLNKYIIYPVSYFQFKLTQQLTQTVARLFQMIITIVLFKWFVGFPKEFHFVMANGVLFVVNIFISSVLFFIMEAIMEIAAFWAENVWSLSVLLRFLISFFSGAWLSLSLFPKWSLPVMNYLPFRTLVYVPIKILFGEISFGSWFEAQLVSSIWIIFFVLIYAFLWGKGRIHYTGVGI